MLVYKTMVYRQQLPLSETESSWLNFFSFTMERGNFPWNQFTLIKKKVYFSIHNSEMPMLLRNCQKNWWPFFALALVCLSEWKTSFITRNKKEITSFNMIKNRSWTQHLHRGWLSTYNLISGQCLHSLTTSSGLLHKPTQGRLWIQNEHSDMGHPQELSDPGN